VCVAQYGVRGTLAGPVYPVATLASPCVDSICSGRRLGLDNYLPEDCCWCSIARTFFVLWYCEFSSPLEFSTSKKMVLLTRGALITSSAEATGVNIATWFLATTFLVMYISRQIVKFVMLRKLQLDDYLMTAGMVSFEPKSYITN
jgi:hypothetical protein